jgi:hypothetical protein
MYHLSGALGAVSLSPQRLSTLRHPLTSYHSRRSAPSHSLRECSAPVPQGRVTVPIITHSWQLSCGASVSPGEADN